MVEANYYESVLAEATEVAHRYNELSDRFDVLTDDELLELASELHQSAIALGSTKRYEMSNYTHDQQARTDHVVSLLPPDRRPTWYGIGKAPSAKRLEQAQQRLAGERPETELR